MLKDAVRKSGTKRSGDDQLSEISVASSKTEAYYWSTEQTHLLCCYVTVTTYDFHFSPRM